MSSTNFDIIKKYCFLDDTIELTDKQQQLLDRWNMVIELRCCESMTTKAIIQKLVETFPIERATAINDIGYAEALFGYNTELNKRFRIGARIDFLEQYIQELRDKEEHVAAAMQEKNLAKWFEMFPDHKKENQKRNLKFSFNADKPLIEDLPTIEDAEAILLDAEKNG